MLYCRIGKSPRDGCNWKIGSSRVHTQRPRSSVSYHRGVSICCPCCSLLVLAVLALFPNSLVVFFLTYPSFGGAAGATGQPIFSLYLKDSTHPTYTVSQINLYPTGVSAVQVVAELIYAWVSDSILNGSRWPNPCVFQRASISLIVRGFWTRLTHKLSLSFSPARQHCHISEGWRWACFMLANQGIIASPISLV